MAEPVTVEEVLALGRVTPGDEELALVPGFISAARQQVEKDTDLVLLDAAVVEPLLKHWVGILAVHYMSAARDLVAVGTVAPLVPLGYQEAMDRFRVESLA